MKVDNTAIVGLVGGLGLESTIDYYRRLYDAWAAAAPGTAPGILIDSLDVNRALRLVGSDREALAEYLAESIERLAAGGAAFAAITANTPHIVFDALVARSPIPLVSIVEACMTEAARRGLRRLALLGTRFTMEAPFYPDVAARHGISIVVPEQSAREWVHDRYVGELLKGTFRDETRDAMIVIVAELRRTHDIDGVILGGTELPLLLGDAQVAGLPTLDTTALHVGAIVARLRASSEAASGGHPSTSGESASRIEG